MRKQKLLIFILIICMLTSLCCCCSARTELQVVEISIKANSFKESYEIDEALIFDNIYFLVTYDNGETTYVQGDWTMVKGYDSTTCGIKLLHIEYEGVSSENYEYEVVYSIDNSKSILTTARMEFSTNYKNDLLNYEISYYTGDLTDVQAIMFTISADQSLNIDTDYSNVSFELPSGWYANASSTSTTMLKVLVYNKSNDVGLSSNTIFDINVNLGNNEAITSLVNIELSTGGEDATKYYLPDYER
jgi:hypothetical protein